MAIPLPLVRAPELGPNLSAAVRRAIGHLFAGGVVIGPTESAYGLFALATRPEATARVAALKGRPTGQPLPLVVGDAGGLGRIAEPPNDAELRLMRTFWPGPLTLVLRARPGLPEEVTAGTGTVGVRMPPHPVTLALCLAAGPLTATSANLSGGPLARAVEEIDPALLEHDVFVVDGGRCPDARPSTVARVSEAGEVEVLREGPITRGQLAAVLASE